MIKLAFLGDIALVEKYDLTKNSSACITLNPLADKLKEYDYVVANLESPLTDMKKTWVCKSMHLRTPKQNVEMLNFLGINAVSLANNHIMDFGKEGLTDTIETLDNHSIEWFGANNRVLNKTIKNEQITFSGFCCYSTNGTGYIENGNGFGVVPLTHNNVIEQLKKDNEQGAFSVLSFHWGLEHVSWPNFEHICLAQKIASIKNVMIHGHHPHVIQGVQKIKGSLIAYSMGNCLFDDCVSINDSFVLKQNDENRKSFILEIIIRNGTIESHKLHGFKEVESSLVFFDINQEISDISHPLYGITDQEAYEEKRSLQYRNVVSAKFGKRNLKWLISRMNYYSIGSRLSAFSRHRKYHKERNFFL